MNTLAKRAVIIYAESTPNPSSMKFVADMLLLKDGATAQYLSKAETKGAPLAAKLFEFPFVKSVFFASNFVTVLKTDAVQWQDITTELRDFIRNYIHEGHEIITELPQTEVAIDTTVKTKEAVFTEHAAPSSEIEVKIIDILEQYIRPAVEADGGSITFKGFNEGIVTVQLRGSCSGCPSATLTLKAGIEALLQRMIPDTIKEVVSEEL